ncbi:MAG: helix-turn-helix domain-containing protein [Pseudonocardiaceae bacterium]
MRNRAGLDQSWVQLGQRLAASRRAARLSQTALGGLIGCVRSTVSHIERARRRSDRTFWRLADQHCRADGALLATFDALEAAEADYRARCEVQQARAELDRLTASPANPLDPNTVEAGTDLSVSGELAGELLRLVERLAGLIDRRELLRLLRWATATAAGGLISLDEWDRLAAVIEAPRRVDAQTIDTLSTFLEHCKHQDDALGPSMVYGTVLDQHGIVRRLLPECPARLRPRLLSLHSNMAASIGDHLVDFNNHDRAQHYFRDARIAGHQAGDRVRAAYALSEASHAAYQGGDTCTAMDTAAATRNLAARTDDALLRVVADLRAAAAHALDGQHAACVSACDRAREGLAAAVPGVESPAYWVHPGVIESKLSEHLVTLGRPREALQAAQAAVGRFDPSFRNMHARCRVRLATALVQCEEIGEAARILGAAAGTASASPSPRLTAELRVARARLQPWQSTHAVKTLDAQLEACGLHGPSPSSGV